MHLLTSIRIGMRIIRILIQSARLQLCDRSVSNKHAQLNVASNFAASVGRQPDVLGRAYRFRRPVTFYLARCMVDV